MMGKKRARKVLKSSRTAACGTRSGRERVWGTADGHTPTLDALLWSRSSPAA